MSIVIEGKTIGVVGVYGNPDEVRVTALLVKMATELLLEREIILERFSSRQKAKEHLVLNLISRETTLNAGSLASLEEQASLLGYSLHLPRAVAICNMEIAKGSSPGYHDLVQNKIRENILSLMEKPPLAGEQDLAVILNDNLVFLKALPSGPHSMEELVSWGQDMVHLIATTCPQVRLKLAAGSIFSEPCDTFFSYHQANFALGLCPEGHFVSIYDHAVLLAYLLKSVETPENERIMESITNKLKGLAERRYNIINTIRNLLECNLNLAETARSLYIHRTTFLFRLKKFKELTGLEPHRNFNDALLCKIAISFLNKSQNTFADLTPQNPAGGNP